MRELKKKTYLKTWVKNTLLSLQFINIVLLCGDSADIKTLVISKIIILILITAIHITLAKFTKVGDIFGN